MKAPPGKPRNHRKAMLEDLVSPGFFFFVIVVFTGVFFSTRNGAPNDTTNGFSCSDNNPTFPWQGDWNRIWDSRMFLSINLARGRFTFSQAKAIDICWDLVVGRGGQMYAAFLAYRIMRRSLMRSMESKPMHIPVAASLIFEGLSISTLGRICKDLNANARKGGTWNWRLVAFLWMIIYLLSFGTVVSAMTGYQAQMTPFFAERSSSSVLTASSTITEEDKSPGVIIDDGKSIGLEPFATLANSTQPDQYAMLQSYNDLVSNISDYDRTACRQGKTNYTAKIEIAFAWSNKKYRHVNSSMSFQDRPYSFGPDALSVKLQDVYIVNGTLMNQTYLVESSFCQPGKTYRWGFSSQLLFMFCIMTIVYAAVIAALHWDVYEFGRVDVLEHAISLYRDILDMAEEINGELGDNGTYLTAEVIKEKIRTRSGAIVVGKDSTHRDLQYSRRDAKVKRNEALVQYATTNYEKLLHKNVQDIHVAADYLESRDKTSLSPREKEEPPMTYGDVRRIRRAALKEYAHVNYKALVPPDTSRVGSSTDASEDKDTERLVTVEAGGQPTVELRELPLNAHEMRRVKRKAIEKEAFVDYEASIRR